MTDILTFFIDQHGCAKNQVDGELIISRLLNLGMAQTFEPAEADLIVVNSCGFIESAKKESLDAVCAARRDYPNAKILLCGCLAERYASQLKDALPEADGIFGNGDLSKLDEIISQLNENKRPVNVYNQEGVCCGDRKVFLGFRGSAFVKITEGCSNHCSFCAIPLIRGELRSRPASEITAEIESLVSQGIVEINLIGQDLAAYGTGENDNVFGTGRFPLPKINDDGVNCGTETPSALSLLLDKIRDVPGTFFVRLLYIHPDHFNRDIFKCFRENPSLLPYFDIPFQSGDNSVIKAMNRKGSSEEYRRLVADIRRELPGAVLRTTFLTGFPGETTEAAAHTVEFLKSIKSDWSGCFPYSREEDTAAYNMKGRVSAKTAQKRAEELVSVQEELTRKSLSGWVGKEIDVLIEEIVSGEDGLAIGRAWFQAPDVDGSVVVRYEKDDFVQESAVRTGRFVRVKVVASSDVDLDAVFIQGCGNMPDNPSSSLRFAPELTD